MGQSYPSVTTMPAGICDGAIGSVFGPKKAENGPSKKISKLLFFCLWFLYGLIQTLSMKTQKVRRNRLTSLSTSRWAAYATAGAATAIAGVNSAEAAIHYSGPVGLVIPSGESVIHSFALDNGGAISFANIGSTGSGFALFRVKPTALGGAAVSNMFLGSSAGPFRYPFNLAAGANIAAGPFAAFNGNFFATLAAHGGYTHSHFLAPGPGFIGFRFNGGPGIEYGWARVIMTGAPDNGFTLVDYAWADPGTAIVAGQTAVPEPASLGLLGGGCSWSSDLAPEPE